MPAATPVAPPRRSRRDDVLRRPGDFTAVMRDGRRARSELLSIGVRPNGLGHNRFGFAIAKRVGGAVVRNRIRRRLRAILRLEPIAAGYDLVITSREPSATATYQQLEGALRTCVRRVDIAAAASVAATPREAARNPRQSGQTA